MGLIEKIKSYITPKTQKESDLALLKKARDTNAWFGDEAKQNANNIIHTGQQSTNPYDLLAVAIAYSRLGAKQRKNAIYYFELFIKSGIAPVYYNNWQIYSDLANLYESEYDFNKAEFCLKQLPKFSLFENCADYIRLGDLYIKESTDKAIKYYDEIMKTPIYAQHKRSIDIAYQKTLELHEKGYVYRPRKNRANNVE